jgi:hypothetical protein
LQARALFSLLEVVEGSDIWKKKLRKRGLHVFCNIDVLTEGYNHLTKRSSSADSQYNLVVGLADVYEWIGLFTGVERLVHCKTFLLRKKKVLSQMKKKNRGNKGAKKQGLWQSLSQINVVYLNQVSHQCKDYLMWNLVNRELPKQKLLKKQWRIQGALFFLLMMPGETVLRTSNTLSISPLHNVTVDMQTCTAKVTFQHFKGKADWPASWKNPEFTLPPVVLKCLYYYIQVWFNS